MVQGTVRLEVEEDIGKKDVTGSWQDITVGSTPAHQIACLLRCSGLHLGIHYILPREDSGAYFSLEAPRSTAVLCPIFR